MVAAEFVDNMAFTRLAQVSLGTFIGGVAACLLPILFTAIQTLKPIWRDFEIPLLIIYGALYNTLMVLACRNDRVLYQVRLSCVLSFEVMMFTVAHNIIRIYAWGFFFGIASTCTYLLAACPILGK